MFRFSREQMVFEIGGVRVGGQPGENPTVMIGSMFYRGDRIVRDEGVGEFDRDAALALVKRLEEISSKTGLPAMLDIVCSTPENAKRYIEFAADAVKMPILIDYIAEPAALSGLEAAKDAGIIDRVVLNSINPETKSSIYDKAREVGLESAIALAYSAKAITSYRERINLLERLIPKMRAAGIGKILVDTVVLDTPTLGLACKAIFEIKERYGYPAGCGAHNAIASWRALRERRDRALFMACSSAVNSLPAAIGADFILYGPVGDAEYIFPAVSLINVAYTRVLAEEQKRPPRVKMPHL